jgi:uncharacterized protein (TIRG00374 family)
MSRQRRRWLRVVVTVILFAGLLRAVPAGEIWNALKSSRLAPLSVAAVLIVISRVIVSVRTRILVAAQGISLSIARIFEIGCVGTLYGMILPGGLSGGIVRWYRLSQPNGKRCGALVALGTERTVDFFVLALLGIVFWIGDATVNRPPAVVWAFAAVAGMCLFVILSAYLQLRGSGGRPLQIAGRLVARLPETVVQGLRRLGSAFADYRGLTTGRVFLVFAVSLLFHLVVTLAQYLMAVCLDLGLSPVTIGWIRACTVLLTAWPVTPAGLGVREVSLVALLAPLGVTAAHAVAYSLLQLSGLLSIVVLGAVLEVRRYLGKPINEHTM